MFINPFKKWDIDRKKRSSNLFSQKQDSERIINTRLKITVGIVVAIFVIIVARLVNLQLINQQSYDEKLKNYTALKQSFSSPRGAILDRNGQVLVESVSSLSVSYYPLETVSNKEEWELAEKIVNALDLKATTITERQLKELHIDYKKVMEKDDSLDALTKKQKEKYEAGDYKNLDEVYEWKVKGTDISKLSDHTKAVYQAKMRMDSYPDNQYKVIAEDINEQQVSYLSENSASFPGFKVTFDWKRQYSETGKDLKSVLGNVSTQTQGVPSEEKDYYLALGYELNDRVGISGLEKQYENYLSGNKAVYDIKFDEDGVAYLEVDKAGKNGYDLTLTIDQGYQKKMDDLVMETLKKWQPTSGGFMSDLFLVAINPKTGEILSMSGASQDPETKEFYSNPTGTYLNTAIVGSIVKPATLYMGLNEGVVYAGQQIMDAPMQFKGSKAFASYTNKGLINDLEAIRQSSNVYMAHIAIGLGGSQYVPNAPLSLKPDTFEIMRTYYNMFGLGVKTGIDLPNEQVGFIGDDSELGTAVYYAIGQYDSYTPMQVAQYVATIANGGKRVQPHLLSKVSEVNDLNTIIYNFKTNVLSTLYGDKELLKRSQMGMELCASSGSCQLSNANIGQRMAGKTGTAEVQLQKDGVVHELSNSSFIGYGPAEDPEIAFACVAPYANSTSSNVCSLVVEQASKEYFANYRNK